MASLEWICLELSLVALASFAISYGYRRWRQRKSWTPNPQPGALFRISIGTALLRTRLVKFEGGAWKLDPPLSSAGEPNLKIGQTVSGDCTVGSGIVRFRTRVKAIEASGCFSLEVPSVMVFRDRRSEPRESRLAESWIEDRKSVCIDLSPLGGRFETDYPAKRGERIKVQLPSQSSPVFGWVLETYPNQLRVRFEERLLIQS